MSNEYIGKTITKTMYLFKPNLNIFLFNCIFSYIQSESESAGIIVKTKSSNIEMRECYFTYCSSPNTGCIFASDCKFFTGEKLLFWNCYGENQALSLSGTQEENNTFYLKNSNIMIKPQYLSKYALFIYKCNQFTNSYFNATQNEFWSVYTYRLTDISNAYTEYMYASLMYGLYLMRCEFSVFENCWLYSFDDYTSNFFYIEANVDFIECNITFNNESTEISITNGYQIRYINSSTTHISSSINYSNCTYDSSYFNPNIDVFLNRSDSQTFTTSHKQYNNPLVFDPCEYIDISYTQFIDINSNAIGGAIYTNLEFEKFNLKFSTFQRCIAQQGGALYLQNIHYYGFNHNCFDSNIALDWNTFCVQSKNSLYRESCLNHTSLIENTEYKYCYTSSFYSSILNYNNLNCSQCFPLDYASTFILDFSNQYYQHQIVYGIFQNCSGNYLLEVSHNYYLDSNYFIDITLQENKYLINLEDPVTDISIPIINNSYFYHIINSELFIPPNTFIQNCYGDENATKSYTEIKYTELKNIPNQYFQCYIYTPEKSKQNTILIVMTSITAAISVILIISLICYYKQRKINIKHQKESELQASILKEFG